MTPSNTGLVSVHTSLVGSQGLEVIPTLYQFYTTFKSPMYPKDLIHIPIKNQSWNHVSISLGRLPRWTKLSEPGSGSVLQRKPGPISLAQMESVLGSKRRSIMELDWNHPLVMALQVTRTRPEAQFQTCLRIGTRLKFFRNSVLVVGWREFFSFWRSWSLLEKV